MCRYSVGKEWFREKLKYHKKRFARSRHDKRAYNRCVKKCEFFERHAAAFDTLVLFNREKKTFSYKYIKVEEDRDEDQIKLLFLPVNVLRSFPSNTAHSA
jgi:hypothetical protein